MLVTNITEFKKNKYKVYIDCEFAFVLYKGELHKYHLKTDEEIKASVYEELTQQVLPKRAKLRAMNLLTKRPYTEAKLREKLKEGCYPEACIETAVSYVKSYGYIDDSVYAKDYICYHMKTESRSSIMRKLQQKGIDAKVIQECMEECAGSAFAEAEQEQIKALFMKKYKGIIPQETSEKMKMMSFFMRKGYASSKVRCALKELDLDDLYN